MHHHDGGARARSARIRSTHDYEATQLESMRRRTRELRETVEHPSRVARMRAALGRLRRHRGAEEALDAPAARATR